MTISPNRSPTFIRRYPLADIGLTSFVIVLLTGIASLLATLA